MQPLAVRASMGTRFERDLVRDAATLYSHLLPRAQSTGRTRKRSGNQQHSRVKVSRDHSATIRPASLSRKHTANYVGILKAKTRWRMAQSDSNCSLLKLV